MKTQVPYAELDIRMKKFRDKMDKDNPNWEMAVIFSKINQYYFTGTMQEGMLVIQRNDDAVYWVRKSFERAKLESLFPDLRQMASFRDAVGVYGKLPEIVYVETEFLPLAYYQRFHKYFPFKEFKSLDLQVMAVRSVKSQYELTLMEEAGNIHRRVLVERVPKLLYEGMSEADLAVLLYSALIEEGHHGVSRFGMFDTDVGLGHICFGESSLYPTYFNGPGGHVGIGPATPLLGSRERKLKRGDLVFVDVGCGVEGYHTDMTMTYMFGKQLPKEAVEAHEKCVAIQNDIATLLRPGEIPAKIYSTTMEKLSPDFLDNFMGYEERKVKFLGHAIGLQIDELPVIAAGFNEPLKENMVFALEPKKGIKDVGMVGVENTFVVTPKGGRCITGSSTGLIQIEC
jgi:Xaa-Pro aminopeptidase